MMKNVEAAVCKPHGLTIDSRERAVITGVEHVDSFDETMIVLSTHGGRLTVTGNGMRVDSLQPEQEKMTVSGKISGCMYEDGAQRRGRSFLRQALGR